MIYSPTNCVGGRYTWEEIPQISIRDFSQHGVQLFSFVLYIDQLFDKNDKLDLSLMKKDIRGVLDVNPSASIFVYLLVQAGPEWRQAHPEEYTEFADAKAVEFKDYNIHTLWMDHDNDNTFRISLASMKWRATAVKRLHILLSALAGTPEGNAVVGFQVAIGIYGEAHYWGFIDHDPDTGPAMTAYFRRWLREKYRTDQALQEAWNDPNASFDTATVPGVPEREHTSDGIFRDPQKERRVIDYYQCQQHVVADDVILFCKTVKESWPRPIVVGTLYTYFFGLFGRQATGGHLESERVLNSPYIDYFRAPMSYGSEARVMGGSGQSRGLLDHVRRHGKLWMDEMDYNTAFGDPFYGLTWDSKSFADDVTFLRRNLSEPFTRGGGSFFWDFGPRSVGGSWHQPDLLDAIGKLHAVFSEYYVRPFHRDADVLFVYDNLVHYYIADSWKREPITQAAIEKASAAAYHSGAVFDETMLADLKSIDWSRYKVVMFMDTYYMTEDQRQYIRQQVERDGRTVVWNFMPGYTDGQSLNKEYVEEVTGMKLEKFTPPAGEPTVVVKADSLPPVKFGVSFSVPMMAVADPDAEVLGSIDDGQHCGLARKQLGNSTSWYASLPITDAALMRAIFHSAGVHIYDDQPDVLYSGGGILTVHTKGGGPRTLRLLNGNEVRLDLKSRSTVILDNETGKVLIGN
ncbi:MAG: hypothetical protein ABR956_02430 [Terracidiphilus sp.]|jgi:hypothetical protein